jgi:hypothetical protein
MSRSRRGPATRPAGSQPRPVKVAVSSPKSQPPALSVQAPDDAADSDANVLPQGLTATFGFDSGIASAPYSATVRFAGQRLGVKGGGRDRGDGFLHEETIDQVIPNNGSVSVSARVYGINAGDWSVQAELLNPPLRSVTVRVYSRSSPPRGQPLQPHVGPGEDGGWSRRRRVR